MNFKFTLVFLSLLSSSTFAMYYDDPARAYQLINNIDNQAAQADQSGAPEVDSTQTLGQCATCLDDFQAQEDQQRTLILNCGHKFHIQCIFPWIVTNNQRSCPTCRQPITISGNNSSNIFDITDREKLNQIHTALINSPEGQLLEVEQINFLESFSTQEIEESIEAELRLIGNRQFNQDRNTNLVNVDPLEDSEIAPNCTICAENIQTENILTFDCNHQMCIECLDNMLNTGLRLCPFCRANITISKLVINEDTVIYDAIIINNTANKEKLLSIHHKLNDPQPTALETRINRNQEIGELFQELQNNMERNQANMQQLQDLGQSIRMSREQLEATRIFVERIIQISEDFRRRDQERQVQLEVDRQEQERLAQLEIVRQQQAREQRQLAARVDQEQARQASLNYARNLPKFIALEAAVSALSGFVANRLYNSEKLRSCPLTTRMLAYYLAGGYTLGVPFMLLNELNPRRLEHLKMTASIWGIGLLSGYKISDILSKRKKSEGKAKNNIQIT